MMESTRQAILDQASNLALSQGEIPSLNVLAAAVGISKGGLMHHFPSRKALLKALAIDGIGAIDEALAKAQGTKNVLRTWLGLSIPGETEIALYQSMASVFFAGKSDNTVIQSLVVDANQRWEAILEEHLGSATSARAARLLGDGLLFGAISGTITSKTADLYLEAAETAIVALIGDNR